MTRILMYVEGRIVPIRGGSKRLIFDVAKYLNGLPDIELTLAIRGSAYDGYERDYAEICKRVVWLKEPSKWGLFGLFNKIAARIGVSIFHSAGVALALRRRFSRLAQDADVVIVNYLEWFPILPARERKEKALCITHDLMFYRRASLDGVDTWLKRFNVATTRFFELRMLRAFNKIAVLGDYECKILRGLNYPMQDVIHIGLPICGQKAAVPPEGKVYDFFELTSDAPQNVAGLKVFLDRVMPLLAPRKVKLALAGNICFCPKLDEKSFFPENCEVTRLGFIDDPAIACAQAKVGVSAVTGGSGIKVKTVELVLRGLPIVSSDHGIEGIPVTNEGVVNLDRLPDEEVKARIVRWLDDLHEAERVGEAQRKIVAEAFAPQNALAGVVDWLRNAAVSRKMN